MRRSVRRGLAAVALATVLASGAIGCGGGSPEDVAAADESSLTGAELGWLRSYAAWTFALLDDDLGPSPGARLVDACKKKLDLAGPPPTDRLRPAAERAADACPLLSHRGSYRRALDIVEESDDLLLPLLLDNQPLPLSSAETQDSRADIALSATASERVDDAIEVRCWTRGDWNRVVSEDNAWFDDNRDPDEIVGWNDDDAGRIHMLLEQCNAIARLRSTDVLGLTLQRQIETADSLSTIAHEIQHSLLPDADEARVECAGARTFEQIAKRLGASSAEVVELARLYRVEVRPDLPSEYLEGGCDGLSRR